MLIARPDKLLAGWSLSDYNKIKRLQLSCADSDRIARGDYIEISTAADSSSRHERLVTHEYMASCRLAYVRFVHTLMHL